MIRRRRSTSRRRAALAAVLIAALTGTLLLPACSDELAPALVLRPGATPAPVAQTEADPVARPHYHYFGEIRMGDLVEHTFTFDNPSARPVTIERALPSCGCLALVVRARDAEGTVLPTGDWRTTDMATVPPGGTLDVTFKVDATKVPVPNQSRLVSADVKTDDPVQELIRLEATVVAVSPFAVAYGATGTLDFGIVDGTQEQTLRQAISQSGPKNEELTGEVLEQPDDWKVVVWEDLVTGDIRTWMLQITIPPGDEGLFRERVVLGARLVETGEAAPARVEEVQGRRAGPVFATPQPAFFRGDTRTVDVRVASRARVQGAAIDRVEVTGTLSAGLDVEVFDGARVRGPGNAWTLTMTLPEDAPEVASGTVVVHFRSGLWPPLEIPYSRFP